MGLCNLFVYSPAKFTELLLSCSTESHIIFSKIIILSTYILEGCGIETL